MYERRRIRPIPFRQFMRRMVGHFAVSTALLIVSLVIGMSGYEHYEALPWRDAFENSSMLLAGMGQVDAPVTNDGKLFAGIYALYAGLVFLALAGILLAPIVHRIMHRLHWEEDEPGPTLRS